MAKMRLALISLVTAVLLTACGGGGDGGRSPSGDSLQITAQNYEDVAREVVESVNSGFIRGVIGLELVVGAEFRISPKVSLVDIILNQSKLINEWWAAGTESHVVGAIIEEVSDCFGGGSVNYILSDINDNERPDPGESVQITYNQCGFLDYTLSGSIDLQIDSLSEDLASEDMARPSSMAYSFTFVDFEVDGGGVMNGSMKFSYDFRDQRLEYVDVVVQGSSETVRLVGLVYSISFNSQQSTSTVSGRVESSSLGGSVVLSTPLPIVSNLPLNDRGGFLVFRGNISQGRLVIAGAHGSATQLRFVDNSPVPLLELDQQGDGSYEVSGPVVWWDEL